MHTGSDTDWQLVGEQTESSQIILGLAPAFGNQQDHSQGFLQNNNIGF